jgi:hypothetical protein
MDWKLLIIATVIATGSFIAISYDYIASRNNMGVGEYFLRKGPVHFAGGVLGIAILIYVGFMADWISALLVAIAAWITSQMLIYTFKTLAQILSLLMMIGGTGWLILTL